ncbi:MAG: hypothetical protein WC517_00595 [Patescibacteria group bacterium]
MIIRRRCGNMRSFSQVKVGGYYKLARAVCVDPRDYFIDDDKIVKVNTKHPKSGVLGIGISLIYDTGLISDVVWYNNRSIVFLPISADEVAKFKRRVVKNFKKKINGA